MRDHWPFLIAFVVGWSIGYPIMYWLARRELKKRSRTVSDGKPKEKP